MRSFIASVKGLATRFAGIAIKLGGPGLFGVAFFDSSFIALPGSADLGVTLMVSQHKTWLLYYVLMATAGSVAGCYLLYFLAEKGGEAFLQKRLRQAHMDRTLALYRRHGLMALMVPALLPPPAPFKLFVLAAGVAEVRPLQFIFAIGTARGARYLALGLLTVYYGDAALELMRTRGADVALIVAAVLVCLGIGWWLWQRRNGRGRAADAR